MSSRAHLSIVRPVGGPVRIPDASQLDWDIQQSMDLCCAMMGNDFAEAVAHALPDREWVKEGEAPWTCTRWFAAQMVAEMRGLAESPEHYFVGSDKDYGQLVDSELADLLRSIGWSEHPQAAGAAMTDHPLLRLVDNFTLRRAVEDDVAAWALAVALPGRVWTKEGEKPWSCSRRIAAEAVSEMRGFGEPIAHFIGAEWEYAKPVPRKLLRLLREEGWSGRKIAA
ncbi:MAG: hypothetical protein EON48_01070 [Acetobacteraceae bacterium]|nr:MAG: hypothetical protein EON48_01070 [Acetobacteraceae bacterium]